MPKRLKLILGLTTILTMALVVFGTVAPKVSNAPAKSPYISALSNAAVGTAVAATHKCSNRSCLVLQGLYFCRSEGTRTNCVIPTGGGCSETACP